MTTKALTRVMYNLRRAAVRQVAAGLPDGELLERYVKSGDQEAFESLLRRHGPMVLGVCRRILRNDSDAEDAFQATFLVLVRKASTIRPREMVGGWLFGVARNTALKARAMIRKRHEKEKQAKRLPKAQPSEEVWQQLQVLLDAELSRLPDKYRLPLVLCELEGQTIKEAARHLGWPDGTVAARLAEARRTLAMQLARHGLMLSAGALVALLSHGAASASVPAPLITTTTTAAACFGIGQTTSGLISSRVAALTEGVIKAMFLTKLKKMMVGVLLLAVAALGGGLALQQTAMGKPGDVAKSAAKEKGRDASQEKKQDSWAATLAEKFEDLAQFNYGGGGGVVSATGIRDKGGFTVVSLKAVAERSKLSVSFAVKEDQESTLSDFRVAVVDAAGKRHQASDENGGAAGGNGIMIFTFVLEFNLSSDKIDSIVIQQRAREKK